MVGLLALVLFVGMGMVVGAVTFMGSDAGSGSDEPRTAIGSYPEDEDDDDREREAPEPRFETIPVPDELEEVPYDGGEVPADEPPSR